MPPALRQATKCEQSYLEWVRERVSFYTGVAYAERRLCDGTKAGLIIALSIGAAHLVLVAVVALCVARCAARRRACYKCMQALCPCGLLCIERCGGGPTAEQKESWGDMVVAEEEGTQNL